MTSTQISTIITELGYSMNEWNDLCKFTIIGIDQEIRLFPDIKHTRFRFNTAKSQLEVSCGSTIKGVYTSSFNETSNFTPNHIFRFSSVAYFNRTTKIMPNGSYAAHVGS